MLKVIEIAFSRYAVTDLTIAQLQQKKAGRIEPLATPVGRMAMIFDPDGNSITIHKRNPRRH